MTQRRHDSRNRRPWPWWKRFMFFHLGCFLNRDKTGISWSSIALTLFLFVESWRLMPQPWENGLRIVPVIGWPDVMLCLLILWGRWIDSAAEKVAARNPDKIVDNLLPKLLDRMGVGGVASSGSSEGLDLFALGRRRVRPDEVDE